MVCHRPGSLNCSIHYSFIHHLNIFPSVNVCTEEPLQSNRYLLGVFSGCYLELVRSLTYAPSLWATWSYLAILSVEQHQRPVGTCKKCRVIGPDLVIHNSGDRGQCNNPKTVAHTEVSRSGVGQSTDTEFYFGNWVSDNQASELSGGDVVREGNTASMLELKTFSGHSSLWQGLNLNNSLKWVLCGREQQDSCLSWIQ